MKNTYDPVTRMFDIMLSLLVLLVLSPLFLLVMLILRFTGENEVFYFQERIGRNKKPFNVIKFATMLKNSPSIGAGAITMRDDPRVLPFGKFLRKSKINELPQLINIFKGEMSFVGPRPLMLKQFNYYDEQSQNIIATLRPGLTGVASIVFRDEERFFENVSDPEIIYQAKIAPSKAMLEKWFYVNKSILLYFSLIIITTQAVLHSKRDFTSFLDHKTRQKLQDGLQ